MLRAITSRSAIKSAQELLTGNLERFLDAQPGKYQIGFPSGSRIVDSLYANDDIWFASFTETKARIPRYWNVLGLTQFLNPKISNSITVEINIPLKGFTGKVAAIFALDSSDGSIYLLHSGKVGGGKLGVGKNSFLKWLNLEPVQVDCEGRTLEYLEIANLNDREAGLRIAEFVASVAEFKIDVEESYVQSLDDEKLEKRAKRGKKIPQETKREISVFTRNQAVVEFSKRRANGRCDLCSLKAPFTSTDGKPFLECHHIRWLSKGGKDSIKNTAALCPNCHRKMHILNKEADRIKLKKLRARE